MCWQYSTKIVEDAGSRVTGRTFAATPCSWREQFIRPSGVPLVHSLYQILYCDRNTESYFRYSSSKMVNSDFIDVYNLFDSC